MSNSGRHFELDEKTLRDAKEKEKDVKVRAKARFTKMVKQREPLKEEGELIFHSLLFFAKLANDNFLYDLIPYHTQ